MSAIVDSRVAQLAADVAYFDGRPLPTADEIVRHLAAAMVLLHELGERSDALASALDFREFAPDVAADALPAAQALNALIRETAELAGTAAGFFVSGTDSCVGAITTVVETITQAPGLRHHLHRERALRLTD